MPDIRISIEDVRSNPSKAEKTELDLKEVKQNAPQQEKWCWWFDRVEVTIRWRMFWALGTGGLAC